MSPQCLVVMGVAVPIPRVRSRSDVQRRLARLRALAWLLDRSIPIGGGRRVGLDPILGLFPGVGDWLGAVLSLYIVYESARLGAPAPLLARMGGNILVEAVIGTVPVLGDLFDFAWQANIRNLALLEQSQPEMRRSRRSAVQMWFMLAAVCVVVLATITGLILLMAKALNALLA